MIVTKQQRRDTILTACALALDSAIEKTRSGRRPCSGDRMLDDVLRGLIGDDKVAELAKARATGSEPISKPRTRGSVAKTRPRSTGPIGLFRLP